VHLFADSINCIKKYDFVGENLHWRQSAGFSHNLHQLEKTLGYDERRSDDPRT
jgi:hypothetical protein